MSNRVALTGKDITEIKGRIFEDFGSGDVVNFDYPNNLVEVKKGKNGNSVFAFNATGQVVTATVRVIKGSEDDKFLNTEMNAYISNPAGYTLMSGTFIKQSGDGLGNIVSDIYSMSAGCIQKIPNVKDNVEGDTEQGETIYTIVFANTNRSMT